MKEKLPKDLYYRTLTPEESRSLVEDHKWHIEYSFTCPDCNGRGCKRCHNRGLIINMCNPRNMAKIARGVNWNYPETGAICRFSWINYKKKFTWSVISQNGHSQFSITMPQAMQILKYVINANADVSMHDSPVELGVEATMSGPPVMVPAGTKNKGQCAKSLTEKQEKAIKVLMDAGYEDEAELLNQALKHECFLVDSDKVTEIRKRIWKIESGTILVRKGETGVVVDGNGTEHIVDVGDSTRSALSVIG